MKRLKAPEAPERLVLSDLMAMAPDEEGYTLSIAGVYQDRVTRGWALQKCRRATQLAGAEHVQNTWHDVHSLSDPAILLQAVRAAVMADVIVVSVYAADELPLGLCLWFAAWLPRRLPRTGALTALIGVTQPSDSQYVRTVEYLQAAASRAQLDFIPQERKRPVASGAPSIKLIRNAPAPPRKHSRNSTASISMLAAIRH